MGTREYFSDNDSGTMADALKAVGLAEVFREWLGRLGHDQSPIKIVDHESYYTITLPCSLSVADIASITGPFMPGRGKLLMSGKQIEKAQKGGYTSTLLTYNYDGLREQSANYFALLKKLPAADRKRFNQNPNAEEFASIRALTPDPDLDLYTYINHFKTATNYNDLLRQWEGGGDIEVFRRNLELILTIFSQHPNGLATAENRWNEWAKENLVTGKTDVTRLQNINPASGKGINATKANNANSGNIDGFWLLEVLKFFGLFTIAAPRMVKSSDPKNKDRKTYVLHPTSVDLESLREVMGSFRKHFYPTTALKLDILVALQFTSRLIEYERNALAAQRVDPFLALFGQAPKVTDIARGFDLTFYKDMGNAYATMNFSIINLPDWLEPVTSVGGANDALKLLKEHQQVVNSMKTMRGDEGSDEFELLRQYRDFLSGHDIERFFEMAAAYGDYYLSRRHQNQWPDQFTTNGMETLVTQTQDTKKLGDIIKSEGFRTIAAAIRQSTVIAQYHAARTRGGAGPSYPYEVRYGLGQEFMRSAAYPADFMAKLGEFVQSYSSENARIDERIAKGTLSANTPRRTSVRAAHLDDIVHLVDDHGSELICKMLVAYGYSRDPRDPNAPQTQSAAQPGGPLENSGDADLEGE